MTQQVPAERPPWIHSLEWPPSVAPAAERGMDVPQPADAAPAWEVDNGIVPDLGVDVPKPAEASPERDADSTGGPSLKQQRQTAWEAQCAALEAERLVERERPEALAQRVRSGELRDIRPLLRAAGDRESRQALIDGFGKDLRGIKLAEAPLQGLDLSGFMLGGCNMREARLSGTNLDGADLTYADLTRADMRGGTARGAVFHCTTLNAARIKNNDLSHADLRGAKLYDTDLSGTKTPGADFRGTKMNRPSGGWGGTRLDDSRILRARLAAFGEGLRPKSGAVRSMPSGRSR